MIRVTEKGIVVGLLGIFLGRADLSKIFAVYRFLELDQKKQNLEVTGLVELRDADKLRLDRIVAFDVFQNEALSIHVKRKELQSLSGGADFIGCDGSQS